MTMAATAYLTDNDFHNAAQLFISEFSGTLRSWWDNYLNDNEINFVQTSKNDDGEQNAVHGIIYASLNILLEIHGFSKKEVMKSFKI